MPRHLGSAPLSVHSTLIIARQQTCLRIVTPPPPIQPGSGRRKTIPGIYSTSPESSCRLDFLPPLPRISITPTRSGQKPKTQEAGTPLTEALAILQPSQQGAKVNRSLTFCVLAVQSVLGKLLQVVFEQHLVARDPLDRLQHVVLQRQVPANILFLIGRTQKKWKRNSDLQRGKSCEFSEGKAEKSTKQKHLDI